MRREYPTQPLVGIGAIILQDDKILMVKRASEPGKGKWSVPGGLVELGEKLEKTVIREVKEETNLDVTVVRLIDAVDNIVYDANGKLRFHFVILDFLTSLKGGNLQPSSDVVDTKWIRLDEAEDYDLTKTFREFIKRNKEELKKTMTSP
ncbi:MAG: NUDIX hydrolase [Candidatus Bathyarchaeales archaeon]